MQLIIDIPDHYYENNIKKELPICLTEEQVVAILPKGHGKIIDVNNLLKHGACPNNCKGTATCANSYEHLHCPIRVFDIESINDALTIIEAESEET